MIEFLFEQLLLPPLKFNRFWFSLVLGVLYSFLGLALAVSTGVGLLAVFVVAIAIQPFLSRFFSMIHLETQRRLSRDESFSQMFDLPLSSEPKERDSFWRDFSPLFSQYTAFFLGIFATFVVFALSQPPQASAALFGITGLGGPGALPVHPEDFLVAILVNNAGVLFTGFFLSLLLEFGASLVTVWNAVFWGVLITTRMREFVFAYGHEWTGYLVLVLILPHLVLEALAYISAMFAGGMAGTILSQSGSERSLSPLLQQPIRLLLYALVFFIVGAVLETAVFYYVLKI